MFCRHSLHAAGHRVRDRGLVVGRSQARPAHHGDSAGRLWRRLPGGIVFSHASARGYRFTHRPCAYSPDHRVLVLLIFLFIAFGATAAGKWFRFYSIGTILTLLVFCTLAGMQDPRVAANLPTPWLGITERVNVYSAMLWVLVLGVVLSRNPIAPTKSQST